jgi:hypothetical protein
MDKPKYKREFLDEKWLATCRDCDGIVVEEVGTYKDVMSDKDVQRCLADNHNILFIQEHVWGLKKS